MASEMTLSITVVYSPQPRQVSEIHLEVQPGSTATDALRRSGVLASLTADEVQTLELGVWGRKVPVDYPLRAHDRVELYRPLTVDPKVARRERFARQGAKGAGLFAKRRAGAKAGY